MEALKKTNLKLGIIGLSNGNGHPYSWSAIFNGYEPTLMEDCGFPIIPRYLEKKSFPEDCIKNTKVTHIWTQSKKISEKIARTCFIENIVENKLDLINKVDGILLARDDADDHYKFAKDFIISGIPIYIDKPLAFNVKDAKKILNLRRFKSQIFTCSALKYADELIPSKLDLNRIGKIKTIEAKIAKDWNRYAIHLIEPVLNLIPDRGELISFKKNSENNKTSLFLKYSNLVEISISTLGSSLISPSILVCGINGNLKLEFSDTFNAFKNALKIFTESILDKKSKINDYNVLEAIRILEIGNS